MNLFNDFSIKVQFNKQLKRKAEYMIGNGEDSDLMEITPLGAGNEVGRSCIMLKFRGKTVMLDAGIHPAHTGLAGLPFFDEIEPSEVDLVLISHFHLDHCASLPYFTEKTAFKGPIFMTHPTKAIYKWILSDYVRVSNACVDDVLYNEQDLLKSYQKITPVDYHQSVLINGIKFTSYNAGHVLGAAMFLIEIDGIKVLYTGDYSREEDRHLMAAERPPNVFPEVLITEATFGVHNHEPRLEREFRFTNQVHSIIQRGGKCLIPVFALGRAQELLLILDEYWQNHPELHSIPIYFASSLAKKCMAVYQTYINMMNQSIKHKFTVSNPFVFKHISTLKNTNKFIDESPCVVIASPGMLQNGLSRQLFEKWCPDPLNGVLICGYCVEGTLAKQILNKPEEIETLSGLKLPLRMSIDLISFAAHVDFSQNSEFIDLLKPQNLILVHGESNGMFRLASALRDKYIDQTQAKYQQKHTNSKNHHCKIFTPKNVETVQLCFKENNKIAKIVGNLAKDKPFDGKLVEGLVVEKDFNYQIINPEELEELTNLTQSTLIQRLNIPFYANFSLLETTLQKVFGSSCITPALQEIKELEEMEDDIPYSQLYFTGITIMASVTIWDETSANELVLEWVESMENDMVSDSVIGVIMSISKVPNPASVKLTRSTHSHSHSNEDGAIISKEVSEEQDKIDKVKANELLTDKLNEDLISISSHYQSHPLVDLTQIIIKFISGYFNEVKISSSNPNHLEVRHPIGYCLIIDTDSLMVINKDNCGEYKKLEVLQKLENDKKISSNGQKTKVNVNNEEGNQNQSKQNPIIDPVPNQIPKQTQEEDDKDLNLSHEELEKFEFRTKIEKILVMVKSTIRIH